MSFSCLDSGQGIVNWSKDAAYKTVTWHIPYQMEKDRYQYLNKYLQV